ncbi:sprouty-related, EVH1 domain-containing protein 2 [Engraulis encrasicolus]|uniref:sprouty-related, EVH1 domain-containing protein 2 n=1 Tax=Engraulis encrasicolus TaxID=184585 RepID=UPI002FD3FD6E
MSEETHPDDDSYIVRVKAVVMTRDDSSGGWLAQEGGELSRVGVVKVAPSDLELLGRHGFLIYGERLKDKQVSLECFLRKDLVYTKANPTFHHWRVDNQKCGLTFQSPADARAFDRGVRKAIEDLTEGSTTSSSTLQNETELGDDDVFTNATDSSSNSSQRARDRETSLQTLAPISLCETRRHQCIMDHLYDQHRFSDHYFMDQSMPSFTTSSSSRHVRFLVSDTEPEEEIVRINPRERAWLCTGYEDYRHAHPAMGRYGYGNNNKTSSTTPTSTTTTALYHPPSSLAALRPLHQHHHLHPLHHHQYQHHQYNIHSHHIHEPFGHTPFLPVTDPDAYVHFDKSDPPKHDYTYPYPSGGGGGGGKGDPHRTEGKKLGGNGDGGDGNGRGVAVVTGQPRSLQSKWRRGLGAFAGSFRSSSSSNARRPDSSSSSSSSAAVVGIGGTGCGTSSSSSSVAVGIAGGIMTTAGSGSCSGERAQCVYCRDLFRREDNRRGHCTEAPDPVRTCIRRVSFMWCADSLLYHCMSDPEGDYSDPCSCDASEGERFWLRWAALLGLSVLAPCMCCYGPLRACHRCGVAVHCCGGRHKAVG